MASNATRTIPSTKVMPINSTTQPNTRPRRPNYNHIHRNLLPVEVHPLPVLIPHNPLSLIAIILSYLTQVLSPPSRATCNGYFSSATSSIHVTDRQTIRRLWEMGFFGRGSLSRSEPTWLENRKRQGTTAEENTTNRRAERRQQKIERARKEQQEISDQLVEEQGKDASINGHVLKTNSGDLDDIASVLKSTSDPSTPNAKLENKFETIQGYDEWKKAIDANGVPTPPLTSASSEASLPDRPIKRLQRTKTVRFSPTTEAREFDLSSPVISPIKSPGSIPKTEPEVNSEKDDQNYEHLNLSLEEAFFLSYGLGVLKVFCDDSDAVLESSSLLSVFRRHSYYPPRPISLPAEPDDPFMLSYAAYHHYRSLGWVVRSGVKFSVDYLLYNRGPAFSHAEFAVTILPSYSHPYWTSNPERQKAIAEKTKKTWWWLHGINRVQAQVHKQLVLCYVDVPPPLDDDEKNTGIDIGLLFSKYKIRDVNIRRWTPNRNRD